MIEKLFGAISHTKEYGFGIQANVRIRNQRIRDDFIAWWAILVYNIIIIGLVTIKIILIVNFSKNND